MLMKIQVPRRFWAKAAQYTFHILSPNPVSPLGDAIPGEKWSKLNPTVKHLRAFGCIAYGMVSYERRIKLDEKRKNM